MFLLEKAIKAFISLPILLGLALLLVFILYKKDYKRPAKAILFSLILISWFLSTTIGVAFLTSPLLSDLKEIEIKKIPSAVNVVVLGGGCRVYHGTSEVEQLSNPSLRRALEGFRIWNQLDSSLLIFSGTDWSRNCNIAEISSNMVKRWTSDTSRILQLNPVMNTREEAKRYAEKFGVSSQVVLVTSAIHMPRAIRNFMKCGVKVIPAPTDFPIHDNKTALWNIMPDMGNFEKSSAAWIEWMANIAEK